MEEEVYMRQPEGFVEKGQEHMVYRLKKSIYGLKQSSRCWNVALNDALTTIGFKQSTYDPCLYVSEGDGAVIGVHVDDLIIAAHNETCMQAIKDEIARKFAVKDLGQLNYMLAIDVDQQNDAEAIWIGQANYTKKVLKKFSMENCKPVSTPMDPGVKLTCATEKDQLVEKKMYQSAVGSLLYLSVWTRPDIAYAVAKFSK
jgi:hypothetical protein